MFGIASRFDVQIRIVASCSLRLHGIILVVGGQLLDLIEDGLTYKVTLFHPSHDAGCGAYLDEAAVMVEHLDAVAILHHSSFFVHGGNAIAQDGLHAGNVRNLEHVAASAITG